MTREEFEGSELPDFLNISFDDFQGSVMARALSNVLRKYPDGRVVLASEIGKEYVKPIVIKE